MGVGVVLLDECHHLASLWGYVVRAVLGELGDQVHVIGLTATPPIGLPEAEAELYAALLGPGRLHRPDARRGARRPPRALPGAGLADRAAADRARVAGRARHPLPRAGHDPARRRRVRHLLPALGRPADARAQALRRRRSRDPVGGVPEALAQARPRRHPLPALRRPEHPDRRAARRGLPPAAGPRRLARAAGGLRAALPGAPARPARRASATTRSPPRCASSASSSRARASGAGRRRSTGC